jgi:hypothetical protein
VRIARNPAKSSLQAGHHDLLWWFTTAAVLPLWPWASTHKGHGYVYTEDDESGKKEEDFLEEEVRPRKATFFDYS